MSRYGRTQTKIICTIGPASQSRLVIGQLLRAGMRAARLNFSHGSYAHHQILIDNIRTVSQELSIPCAIIQDLSGPKIRLGQLSQTIELQTGESVLLVMEKDWGRLLKEKTDFGKVIPLQSDLSSYLVKNDILLIDDGAVELKVL